MKKVLFSKEAGKVENCRVAWLLGQSLLELATSGNKLASRVLVLTTVVIIGQHKPPEVVRPSIG